MPLLGSSSSPWLWPHCQRTCLHLRPLFWSWTHWTPTSMSLALTHVFLSCTFSTFLSHCLMASPTRRCLCPLSSVCFIPPDFLTAVLLLFLWLQPAELNIAAALFQQICRLHQIRLPSLYPITDGSSKLIQDLSRTNVTPCFCFKQIVPRSALTVTSALNTWGNLTYFAVTFCLFKEILRKSTKRWSCLLQHWD